MQAQSKGKVWVFAIGFLASPALSHPSLAEESMNASGTVRSRSVRVETSRLVTILGGAATEPEQVFSVPVERFVALGKNPDSGVQVEENDFRLRGSRIRIDGITSREPSYVLVDLANSTMQWVHPAKRSYVEWRKPAAPTKSPTPPPRLEPLDREATINGFRARGYRLHAESGTAWLWIAQEPKALAPVLRAVADLQLVVKPTVESFEQVAAIRGMQEGVLIRLQALTPKEYIVRELVSFTPKAWDAADFRIPAGWKGMPVERAGAATQPGSCQNCE